MKFTVTACCLVFLASFAAVFACKSGPVEASGDSSASAAAISPGGTDLQ